MDEAKLVYSDSEHGSEIVRLGSHRFEMEPPSGYCHEHRSYGCFNKLTDDEKQALDYPHL